MEKHFERNDVEFMQQFNSCELNPAIFSHEAHLRLAWLLINRDGIEKAEKIIQQQLQQFVKSVGAEDKYNKTLTIAAMKAVDHFMKKSASDNFKDFIEEFPALKYNFKALMRTHYSFDIYNLPKAKEEYMEPDLVAFD